MPQDQDLESAPLLGSSNGGKKHLLIMIKKSKFQAQKKRKKWRDEVLHFLHETTKTDISCRQIRSFYAFGILFAINYSYVMIFQQNLRQKTWFVIWRTLRLKFHTTMSLAWLIYPFSFWKFTESSNGRTFQVNDPVATGVPVPPPGGLVVASVDEVPPPSYTTVSGGTPVVTCRVCQVRLSASHFKNYQKYWYITM